MHAYLRSLPAAFALAFAVPASALWVPGWEKVDPIVLSGTLDGDFYGNWQSFLISSPGRYRLSWSFDRPLGVTPEGWEEYIFISFQYGWVFDQYEGGEWDWGTSETFDDYIPAYSSGQTMLFIDAPEIVNEDDEGYRQYTYWSFLSGIGIEGSDFASPLNYRLTLTQVPEPATWAMMILGFGLVGMAARRRAGTRMLTQA